MSKWAYLDGFHRALQEGDLPAIRMLAQLGIDLDAAISWESNEHPLGFAIRGDNLALLHTLLECGANPDEDDYEGDTPTQIAIRGKHYKALRMLLEVGEPQARTSRAIHALHNAAELGDAELVGHLLNSGVDIDAPDTNGYTPLMTAIGRFADLECMSFLPDRSEGRAEVVRLLLERGADVHLAAASGHSAGLTAMYCAAGQGYLPLVSQLQDAGAAIPLSIAAMLGDTDRVRLLLAQGESPNLPDFEGATPLHYAAERGYTEIVRLLTEQNADLFVKNHGDESPLYLAAYKGHIDTARALLHAGAGREQEACVLSHAASAEHRDMVLLLLEAGWDVDGDVTEGLTPLMEAAVSDLPEMVHLLAAQGAGVNLANPSEYTALMCAAQHNRLAAGRALIEVGADINTLYEHNMTTFAEALSQQNLDATP